MASAPTVSIDGKEYEIESLNDAAKANLNSLRIADREIARVRTQLRLMETARAVYAKGVEVNLPKEADASAE
ncbi:hypothetical protein [Sphingomonas sp.]|uniref:hypothetical protein n=1 Tax=Sphingomonas sp. TaxID=28214 RepID=UPI002C78128B|nr:hypothetical protein [Sphingomonas sp.]HWK36462.1 hypothetical protein [Sphingomonas sp.]